MVSLEKPHLHINQQVHDLKQINWYTSLTSQHKDDKHKLYQTFGQQYVQQRQRTSNFSSVKMLRSQRVIPQIHQTWMLDMNEHDSGIEMEEDLSQLPDPWVSQDPVTHRSFSDWNFPLLASVRLLCCYTMWQPKKTSPWSDRKEECPG